MRKYKPHILFWIFFYLIALFTDKIVDKNVNIIIHFLFFLLRNVVMFYTLYFALVISDKNGKISVFLRIFYIIVSVGISFLSILLYREIKNFFLHEPYTPLKNLSVFFANFLIWFSNSAIYAGLFYFFEKNIASQRKLMNEEKKRLEVDSAFLRAQINPHFLQNTLNYFYASALAGKSKDLAEGILLLSNIMRYSLAKSNGASFVFLEKEIEFIESYIKINQLRFSNRLNVILKKPTNLEMDGMSTLPLVLITLVENAFKHGELEDEYRPIIITLLIDENTSVTFTVKNAVRIGPKEISSGIGLHNTISRLKNVYGDSYHLAINESGDFYETILSFPGHFHKKADKTPLL